MAADVSRVLHRLAIQRLGTVAAVERTACNRGWMRESEDRLGDVNLPWLLDQPRVAPVWTKENWRSMVHKRVDDYEEHQWTARIQGHSTLEAYARIKHWGVVTDCDACYSGEVGRPRARVLSRYLDDRFTRKGMRLTMLCRAGAICLGTPLIGCAPSATLLQSSRSITSCSIVVGTTAPESCFSKGCVLLLVRIKVAAVWRTWCWIALALTRCRITTNLSFF
jgi:hypothetical protein